jgi:Predicted aminopeptidases
MIRGSDPRLRDEYIVFTAHLDHVGIGREVNGDTIYNGAVDNASGVAALLESARAWAALPQRPRRSIVFLAVTAEEVGLLGADYYANHPTVPGDNIVANVNVDSVGAFYPLHDIVVLGGEHSTMGEVAARVGQQMGLALSADPMPEQNFFVRSDHYAFVRRGIPAMVCFAGLNSGDSDKSGDAIFREWLRTHYHRPSDDMKQHYDFTAAARFTEFHFRVALEVAQAAERPSWKSGDFFGDTFGRR